MIYEPVNLLLPRLESKPHRGYECEACVLISSVILTDMRLERGFLILWIAFKLQHHSDNVQTVKIMHHGCSVS